jgi:hypothetical protein
LAVHAAGVRRCTAVGHPAFLIAPDRYFAGLRSLERIFAAFRTIAILAVTIIEIRPFRNGWTCFEASGVEPVFLSQGDAIGYAKGRACFRSGEISDYHGNDKIMCERSEWPVLRSRLR